jgi:hypothetical protein
MRFAVASRKARRVWIGIGIYVAVATGVLWQVTKKCGMATEEVPVPCVVRCDTTVSRIHV